MSAAYVTAPPVARAEGDVLWLDLQSGNETMSFALTRNAAVCLMRAVTLEVRGPLFATQDGEIVSFKKAARKRSEKKGRAA